MARLLRHACKSIKPLAQNEAHGFAARYALVHHASGAVFSFIPKNGCTTLRYSLALANGCVRGPDDFLWIHANNQTFAASLAELQRAPFTFAVLRDPYRRLASVFLDKFVSKDPVAWDFRRRQGDGFDLDDLTFREFVTRISDRAERKADEHWRPQVDFLVYEDYDALFRLEDFAAAAQSITERTGMAIEDARALSNHGSERYDLLSDKGYGDTPVWDIRAMQRKGQCPDHLALYDFKLFEMVRRLYADDVTLYRKEFGVDALSLTADKKTYWSKFK